MLTTTLAWTRVKIRHAFGGGISDTARSPRESASTPIETQVYMQNHLPATYLKSVSLFRGKFPEAALTCLTGPYIPPLSPDRATNNGRTDHYSPLPSPND